MLVAGAPRWTRYLPNRIFAESPQREMVGHAPIWRLPGVLRRLRAGADLTIARVDRLSARLFFDDDYLVVPEWIGTRLPLPIDVAALAKRNSSVSEDLRKTRHEALTVDVSRDLAELPMFYHRMFVPYTRNRYGDDAFFKGFHQMHRSFRNGGLLWVCSDGKPVAGELFEHRGGTLDLVAIGVAGGDIAWRQKGAVAALYVHVIDYAQRHGCTEIDMRGARPSLADGLLRYKCKWGAMIYDKLDAPHASLVHWPRLDGVAAGFLADSPLVFRDGDGLSGLAVIDRAAPWTAADLQRARDKLWVGGLRRLCLVGSAEQPADLPIPADVRLIGSDRVRESGPRAFLTFIGKT